MIALICILATAGPDTGVILGRVALVIGVQAAVIVGVYLSVAAIGGGEGDEPGSDDEGPGWHSPDPRRPPPEPHVSWADFERQFAEHVEAQRSHDKVPAA